MFPLDFFNFIIALFLLILTIIIFRPINKKKKLKTKEDQLFLQKTLFTTIFCAFIILAYILFIFNAYDATKIYLMELFFFNFYVFAIVLYNLYLSFELYSTYVNPVHFFNRLFKQQKYNYIPEFIIFLLSILALVIDLGLYFPKLLQNSENDNDYIILYSNTNSTNGNNVNYYTNDSIIFIILGKWKQFIIIILCIISLIFCFKTSSKMKKFCFKNQEKLYVFISKRKMSNGLYLVYGLFYILPVVTGVKITELYNVFGAAFFMIIIFNDFLIHLSIISTSKFCEYSLKRTLLGYFCSCFYKPPKYTGSSAPLVNESSINEVTGMTTFQNETTTALDIITNNPRDKELVSIYKNGIFLEDYFYYYFDQILNIITISIFQAYNSNNFSSQANEQRLSSNIKIGDMSSIGGTMQSMTVSNIGNKTTISSINDVGDETARFKIKKNMEKDELHRFKEVLENGINVTNNNNYLNIDLKSFFTQRCVESIYEQKLKGKNISTSMLSHMILTNNAKNRNFDNPNSYYWSLLASNGKEEYFNKLKNTSIKTYDKNFTLDIFDSNDEEISFIDKGKNNALSVLLDKYFTYIHGKGINGTFIPSLVGVFKIKINEFKTLLIFVTRNSLVENVPKNFFTYWQLIRFLNDKPQKMASSQFSSGTLVKDDPIFERSFQIETKKDNPNYNKIFLKNFNDFAETIQGDIEFLKQCGSQNFDLLLMYYEYENTQKHEKQGAIKIQQTNHGTEIIEESLPKGDFFDDGASPINKFGSKMPDSLGGGFLSMGGAFLDDNEFSGGKNLNINNANKGNLIDFDEKISINGYDGVFDSFNCLCYFTFENVFDIRKRLSLAINYYNNFKEKIMENFTEFKK